MADSVEKMEQDLNTTIESSLHQHHPTTTTITTTPNNDSYWQWDAASPIIKAPAGAKHGKGGVYYGGSWLDIEDCADKFIPGGGCDSCVHKGDCKRSMSRNATDDSNFDVILIGAGCIGGAVARELSRYALKILWVEAADDVSQGATKGNSGIVHAGYDDKPGTNRAKLCWKGNQMFADLDKDLRFGYQKNGSLVVAFNDADRAHLEELKKRGETNGVKHLRIVEQEELRKMEPYISKEAVAALHAREAGNVIPYEFAIALAENAVDNGVELRIRREVQKIEKAADGGLVVSLRHWEPESYVRSQKRFKVAWTQAFGCTMIVLSLLVAYFFVDGVQFGTPIIVSIVLGMMPLAVLSLPKKQMDIRSLVVAQAGEVIGVGGTSVEVPDMLVGGSGSSRIQGGVTVAEEKVSAKYVINCAGGASDKIAKMVGDNSFYIKPRIGDYILLHRDQGKLAKHTLFPCPDPVLGKGVLVQTTLWSNLILGPTARDMHNDEAKGMETAEIQEYILSRCKKLVPDFDPKETIHTFCGARAKNSRGDWIIEPSQANPRLIHVAGIDSPGLAGSPAIAKEVIGILKSQGLEMELDRSFNPSRAPIITPKKGMRGLKFGPAGKNDSDGSVVAKMAANVICKCELVTELEVVRAVRRALPIDSSQAIRKRTRAGMGHCQGDPGNYNCEARVKAIIARETGYPMEEVGGRPWPATSILPKRWIDADDKKELEKRMNK